MDLNIRTISFITVIFHVIQLFVFFYQYKANKKYEGPGWWFLYSLAFLFSFLIISIRSYYPVSGIPVLIQHTFMIGGILMLYTGFMKFIGKKVNKTFIVSAFLLFMFFAVYFLLIKDDAQKRFGLLNAIGSIICFFIFYNLVTSKAKSIRNTTIVISITSVLNGIVFLLVAVLNITLEKETGPFIENFPNELQYLNLLTSSFFWTLGIVVMLNKRLNKDIEDSAEYFKLIFEASPDAVLLIRTDNGIIVNANSIAENMLGYSRDEMIGKTPLELNIWDNLDDRAGYLKHIWENNPYSKEVILRQKSGNKIIAIVSINEVNINGINHHLGVAKDVSKLKEEEKKFQEINERFRISFENANIGICIVGLDGRFTRTNRMMSKIFGYSEEEFSKMDVNTITHPDYINVSPAYIKDAIENKSDYNEFEKVYIHKNGSKITGLVSSTLIRDSEGIPLYFISHVNDITNIKQSEELIKAEEEKYRLLAENMTDVIWTLDTETLRFTYVSPSVFRLRGYTPEEIMAEPMDAALTPEGSNYVRGSIAEKIKKLTAGEDSYDEFQVDQIEQPCKDGSKVWTEVITKYYYNENNKKIEIHGVTRDISERKRAEIEIQKKNDELTKLNAEKDKFFSIIAHDLRSPFNGLLGITDLLVNEMNSFTEKELKETALTLNKSANNLYRLLNNLLEWSKVQREITEFNPVQININELITETVNLFGEMATQKGITIETDLGKEAETRADKFMIDTIVRNLVSNAVKFTNRGGRITIKTRKEVDKVKICVKDTGIGMPEEIINNMFKIDKNISRHGTNEEAGTGLGLLLCKEFVEKHGGKLTVTSEEGKGSEFCFEIRGSKKNAN